MDRQTEETGGAGRQGCGAAAPLSLGCARPPLRDGHGAPDVGPREQRTTISINIIIIITRILFILILPYYNISIKRALATVWAPSTDEA